MAIESPQHLNGVFRKVGDSPLDLEGFKAALSAQYRELEELMNAPLTSEGRTHVLRKLQDPRLKELLVESTYSDNLNEALQGDIRKMAAFLMRQHHISEAEANGYGYNELERMRKVADQGMQNHPYAEIRRASKEDFSVQAMNILHLANTYREQYMSALHDYWQQYENTSLDDVELKNKFYQEFLQCREEYASYVEKDIKEIYESQSSAEGELDEEIEAAVKVLREVYADVKNYGSSFEITDDEEIPEAEVVG